MQRLVVLPPIPLVPLVRLALIGLSAILLGAQAWGVSLLGQHMRAAVGVLRGDPDAASMALFIGKCFVPGTVLLLLLQVGLLPRRLPAGVLRRMMPLLGFFVLTELVWLGWALQGFAQGQLLDIGGAAAALAGLVAPIASGVGLLRLRRPGQDGRGAWWRITLLVFLCTAAWLWSQAFWFAVSLEA